MSCMYYTKYSKDKLFLDKILTNKLVNFINYITEIINLELYNCKIINLELYNYRNLLT